MQYQRKRLKRNYLRWLERKIIHSRLLFFVSSDFDRYICIVYISKAYERRRKIKTKRYEQSYVKKSLACFWSTYAVSAFCRRIGFACAPRDYLCYAVRLKETVCWCCSLNIPNIKCRGALLFLYMLNHLWLCSRDEIIFKLVGWEYFSILDVVSSLFSFVVFFNFSENHRKRCPKCHKSITLSAKRNPIVPAEHTSAWTALS